MKNRYNVRCIVTLFEDNSSLKQRSGNLLILCCSVILYICIGRVGRMDKGQVHYTFTEKRYKSIMDSDHCEIRYNSRFTLVILKTFRYLKKMLIQGCVYWNKSNS